MKSLGLRVVGTWLSTIAKAVFGKKYGKYSIPSLLLLLGVAVAYPNVTAYACGVFFGIMSFIIHVSLGTGAQK